MDDEATTWQEAQMNAVLWSDPQGRRYAAEQERFAVGPVALWYVRPMPGEGMALGYQMREFVGLFDSISEAMELARADAAGRRDAG